MKKLNKLEEAVLQKLVDGSHPVLNVLRKQIAVCEVKDRENTGVGFYTNLKVRENVERSPVPNLKFGDVVAEISGLQHGAGFLLYIEDGYLVMLEGYSYGEPWPDTTDRFELSYVDGVARDWNEFLSVLGLKDTEQEAILKMSDPNLSFSERLAIADDATKKYPKSARIWCILGDLIQLGDDDGKYELSDVRAAYLQAYDIDDDCVEALEELGHYCDCLEDDLPAAENYFRRAIEKRASAMTVAWLARVVAQQGKREEAMQLLSDVQPSPSDQETFEEIVREIQDGTWDPK